MTAISSLKKVLRQQLLSKRRSLSSQFVSGQSIVLHEYLNNWPLFCGADTLMLYLALPDEPQTDAIIADLLACQKTVCVPLLGPEFGKMDAVIIENLNNLIPGRFGLRQPALGSPTISPEDIDLIAVPGVAFDRAGNRIGMGAGYYDRFLAYANQATLVGMAWDFQILPDVPGDVHDIRMEYLVTESGIITCR